MGSWQNSPSSHVPPDSPPQAAPSAHAPSARIETPAASAKQELLYDVPSQPHTGAKVGGQIAGRSVQIPVASAEHTPSSSLQNWSGSHVSRASPPHATPSPSQAPA